VLLGASAGLAPESGVANPGAGGIEATDLVGDASVATGADVVPGAELAGLCVVDVTGARSVVGGATSPGAGGSALVTGGFAVVVGAPGRSEVATGAGVVACTAGGGGSGACVCGWRTVREDLGMPEVTTHSLRKTVATLIDDEGLSARIGADHLGHTHVSMTQDRHTSRGRVQTSPNCWTEPSP
jgi:hypothetical protein